MPITLVNPVTQAQGAPGVPNSPLAGVFNSSLNALQSNYPTLEERAKTGLYNSETAKNNQVVGAGGELADVFGKAMQGPGTPEDNIRTNLPALVQAMAHSGHIENAPALGRMMSMYVPGAAQNVASTPVGTPSIQDLAMMGAGDNANSTWGGVAQHENLDTQRQIAVEGVRNQGQMAVERLRNELGNTGEQKNRRVKIQALMESQGVDYSTAEGIADGVIKAMPDQNGNIFLVNEAAGTSKLLRSPAQGIAPTPAGVTGGAPVAAPSLPGAGGTADDRDYLTQLTEPRPAGPGAPGGPVPLTGGSVTPPAAPGSAPTSKDLGIDFKNIYGGGATASRIAGGIYSAMGGTGGPAAAPTENLRKLQNVATQLIAIESLRPGMRSNGAGLKMLANQYPPTESSITNLEDLTDMATHDPQGSEAAFNQKLADAIQNRQSDAQALNDPNLSKEERNATKERIGMFDKMVAQQPPAVKAKFMAALNGGAPAAAPVAIPAPVSNLQAGTAATSAPADHPPSVPLAPDGVAAPRNESDYLKLPDGAKYHRPGDPPEVVRTKGATNGSVGQ